MGDDTVCGVRRSCGVILLSNSLKKKQQHNKIEIVVNLLSLFQKEKQQQKHQSELLYGGYRERSS